MSTEKIIVFGALAFGAYYLMKRNGNGSGANSNSAPAIPADSSVQVSGAYIPHHARYQFRRAALYNRPHVAV